MASLLSDSPKKYGIYQLMAGAAMISFSGVFVKLANVGPTVSAFYRMFFGWLLLMVICVISRKRLWHGWRVSVFILTCGLFFTLDLLVWHRSVLYVGPGLATILTNFQVFFLAGFGIIILGERLTLKYAFSVPMGLFGLFLIMGGAWSTLDSDYKLGVLFGLLAALAYSCYLLTMRKLQSRGDQISPLSLIAIISLCTTVLLAVQMVLEGESFVIPDCKTWISLIAYGFVGQVLGWVLISRGIAKVDASRVGLVLLLQPSLSFIWDILFFKRPAGLIEILGCIIAITAIYMGSVTKK